MGKETAAGISSRFLAIVLSSYVPVIIVRGFFFSLIFFVVGFALALTLPYTVITLIGFVCGLIWLEETTGPWASVRFLFAFSSSCYGFMFERLSQDYRKLRRRRPSTVCTLDYPLSLFCTQLIVFSQLARSAIASPLFAGILTHYLRLALFSLGQGSVIFVKALFSLLLSRF